MSHSVTVTRTTTTTTTSAIIINSGYLKTWPGIFKLFQLLLGIVNVGLVGHYYKAYSYQNTAITFFLLIAVTFLIGTFLLLLSCLLSISTASIISKTIYEFTYHIFAFILYLAASLTLLIEVNQNHSKRWGPFEEYFAAAIIGLVVSVLYILSAIWAYRSYRGLSIQSRSEGNTRGAPAPDTKSLMALSLT